MVKVLLANEREAAKKGGKGAASAQTLESIGQKDETMKEVLTFLDALAVMEPEDRARVPGYVHLSMTERKSKLICLLQS